MGRRKAYSPSSSSRPTPPSLQKRQPPEGAAVGKSDSTQKNFIARKRAELTAQAREILQGFKYVTRASCSPPDSDSEDSLGEELRLLAGAKEHISPAVRAQPVQTESFNTPTVTVPKPGDTNSIYHSHGKEVISNLGSCGISETTIPESRNTVHMSPKCSVKPNSQGFQLGSSSGAGQTSWSNIVKQNLRAASSLHYCKPIKTENGICVKPPLEIGQIGTKEWEGTLVGYFFDKKLAFPLVNSAACKLWNSYGLNDVLANSEGFFFFKFSDKASCLKVLELGPWHIAGQPLFLKLWEPNLSLTKDSYQSLPLWVNFYNVPLEYWTLDGLSYIASAIGKPLYADEMTENKKRISYARICVEVDLNADLVESFNLELPNGNTILIRAQFTWLPKKFLNSKRAEQTSTQCNITKQVWQVKDKSCPAPPTAQKSALTVENNLGDLNRFSDAKDAISP